MEFVYILKVVDHSDFQKVLHTSAHSTMSLAIGHADTALTEARSKVDAEYHRSVDYDISEVPFIS